MKEQANEHTKKITKFNLFDFFGNCEYFEEKFNYDEILKLPPKGVLRKEQEGGTYPTSDDYDSTKHTDPLKSMKVQRSKFTRGNEN